MTPNEIQSKTFEKKVGGYKVEDVHVFLSNVAAYLQSVLDEKRELEEKMMVLAEKVEEYREDEKALRSALINAQKMRDSVVGDAQEKAKIILDEAQRKADAIVHDARSNIDREALALTRMQGQVAEFKTKIMNMYKRHMDMISEIPEELNLPGDVKKIVVNATQAEEERVQKARAERRNSFVLQYEQTEEETSAETESEEEIPVEIPAMPQAPKIQPVEGYKQKKPHSDYGKLRFGEEYNLKRND